MLGLMRGCAKFGCEGTPVATVGVRYQDRLVLVGELVPEPDPNLLDLCQHHLDRLTPPRGWEQVDVRHPAQPAAQRLPA
ncbi:MAG TPA: DUF3499 family protein [Actinomycetota bacterium]|jgi:hypothetical protein